MRPTTISMGAFVWSTSASVPGDRPLIAIIVSSLLPCQTEITKQGLMKIFAVPDD